MKTQSEEITPAACETAGQQKYTATFTNPAFAAQSKTVDIPAANHDYQDGVCAVCGQTAPDFKPKIISGDGASQSVGTEFTFRANLPFADFRAVEVDGVRVDPANYEAREGSTIVTLKTAYLSTLAPGQHRIDIIGRQGTASGSFTITANASPKTGDNGMLAVYVSLLGLSALGLVAVVGGKKRRA